MKKYEYLSELEKRLSALPEAERRDALNYYEEYFDAAGTDNEDATAAALGDPAEAARKILEGEGLTEDDAPAEPPVTPPAAPEPPAADPASCRHAAIPPVAGVVLGIIAVLAVVVAVLVCLFGVRGGSVANTARALAASVVEPPQEADPTTETIATTGGSTSQKMDFNADLADVKTITFDIDYGTVTVVADKNAAEPTLTCTHLRQDWLTFTNAGDSDTSPVYIAYKTPSGFDLGSDLGYEPQFTLTVPARDFALDALDITVAMGDVKFTGGIEADTMNITVNMGNFSGQTVTAKEFSADVDMGNFDLDKLYGAQATDISVSMGNIGLTVDGSAADYDLDLTTDMGEITFNGLEQGEAHHTKSTQPHPRSLILAADMGDVVLTTEQR